MKPTLFLFVLVAAIYLAACLPAAPSHPGQASGQPMRLTPAQAFLASLDEGQRAKVLHPFADSARVQWHFVPWSMYPREGLPLDEMNQAQQEAAFALLRDYLSQAGYDKTRQVMSLEEVLADIENDTHRRDPEKYYVAFFGQPGQDSVWGWTFEGHHVSVHFTQVGDQVAMTPRFLGANPGEVPSGPRQGERVLGEEEDLGLALLHALDDDQRAQAIFRKEAYPEVVTFHDSHVEPMYAVGLAMIGMTAPQQQMLSQLIQLYLDQVPPEHAAQRLKQLKEEEWPAVRFGWAGETELGKPHYYRIQGRTFLIEFDNTQNDANHIHVVWRDFDGDFGRDLLREHQATHHSH